MNDIYVKEYLMSLKQINKKYINKDIYDYIINRYNDSISFEESVYRIKNNIEDKPICPICGKKINGNRKGFPKTCSIECSGKLSYLTRKNNLIKLYNVENVFQLPEIKEKIKKTNLDKYGVEYPFKSDVIRNKYKNTCLKKYGVDNSSKNIDIQNKIKETTYKHYGVYCGCNLITKEEQLNILKKSKNTCLQKYGVDNPWKIPDVIERIQDTRKEHMNEILLKMKQTCFEKYGVYYFVQSKKFKESINWEEKKKKEYLTKKKNGTLNSSSIEDESYVLIKEKYPDVIRQYKSYLYPFNCDFYIPSINTYIECNYFWTHGNKPYEGTVEDNIKLNKWKEFNTEFYNNAIETWTIRDVNKRNMALHNKLNYKEFFNINDLIIWLV